MEDIVDNIINRQSQANMLKKYLNEEINAIKNYAAWNGFPTRIANSIIIRALQSNDSNTTGSKKANADSIKIFFNLNY